MNDLLIFPPQARGNEILLPITGKKVVGIEGFNYINSDFGASYAPPVLPPINNVIYLAKTFFVDAYINSFSTGNQNLLSITFDISTNYWTMTNNNVVDGNNDSISNLRVLHIIAKDVLFYEMSIAGLGDAAALYSTVINGYKLTITDV